MPRSSFSKTKRKLTANNREDSATSSVPSCPPAPIAPAPPPDDPTPDEPNSSSQRTKGRTRPTKQTRNRKQKRTLQDAARTDRRARVAQLYLEGHSMAAIAKDRGVNVNTIAKDMDEIRLEWQALCLSDFDTKLREELARISKLEAAAWAAWERSCEDSIRQSRKVEEGLRSVHSLPTDHPSYVPPPRKQKGKNNPLTDGRTKSQVLAPTKVVEDTTREGRYGDSKFLERVAWCIDTRLRLMGAYKSNPTNVNQLFIQWDELYNRTPAEQRLREDPIEAEILSVNALPAPQPAQPSSEVDHPLVYRDR